MTTLQELIQSYKEWQGNDEQMSVTEIMEHIRHDRLGKDNFEELVPQMLRAVCKDEYVDAVEEFIKQFDNIEWNWYPNG